jgi:nucleoside-diphosphate-sugar epimerase
MKRILVCGAGGFIGGAMVKRLKEEGCWVRGVDIKSHEFINMDSIADDFILGDLRDPRVCNNVVADIDEIYQFAADMGGAGYIFTGDNDANVMHNSAMINLNIAEMSVKHKIKRIFYSSSACMYPEHNQRDPNNPLCSEDSAYPAAPDSEYGWEKLFSERLWMAFSRNYSLNVRICRYHNIFGPEGTWDGGKEKAPAAICRKVGEANNGDSIEVWGDGQQTRSFLYIDECIEATRRLMDSDCEEPLNIGSEEMVTINQLAEIAINISQKDISINNLQGQEFIQKYGYECPIGVRGRNSDNSLYRKKINWVVSDDLRSGMDRTYPWILGQIESRDLLADEKETVAVSI